MTLPRTPSQTVGPFFTIGTAVAAANAHAGPDTVQVHPGIYHEQNINVTGDDTTIVGPKSLVDARTRTLTDAEGRYRFVTIRPGEYPWRNHYNAWRPAHIHFSLFGPAIATRLVTQMYFPGDPLMDDDPMFNSVPDERARKRLISHFDWETTIPETALGYKFDIVLRGRDETPMENYLPARS